MRIKTILAKSELIVADIDMGAIRNDRLKNSTFNSNPCRDIPNVVQCKQGDSGTYPVEAANNVPTVVQCALPEVDAKDLRHPIPPHPFVPSKKKENEVLSDVFNIQITGLAKRLLHTGIEKVTIGVSGGLDSTLALLVTIATFDKLQLPRQNIIGITMPGLGTTKRTFNNAIQLMEDTDVTIKEIPINKAVEQHFMDIGQDPDEHNITYENSQARERTQILMDYANKIGGLLVGTGNMSELALGWTTYNGDHMSMYAVNTGVPKTLVSTLWYGGSQRIKSEKEPSCAT